MDLAEQCFMSHTGKARFAGVWVKKRRGGAVFCPLLIRKFAWSKGVAQIWYYNLNLLMFQRRMLLRDKNLTPIRAFDFFANSEVEFLNSHVNFQKLSIWKLVSYRSANDIYLGRGGDVPGFTGTRQ
jgi:hypothetical protein